MERLRPLRSCAAIGSLLLSVAAAAQATDYTYLTETFDVETDATNPWSTAGATVKSATGTWTTNQNVATAANGGHEGVGFSFATNKDGLTTPNLPEGAGTLRLWAQGVSAKLIVESATALTGDWKEEETFTMTASYTEYVLPINKSKVRYVRLRGANSTTSAPNWALNIDEVIVSKLNGKDANNETVMEPSNPAYWTYDFEPTEDGTERCPGSRDTVTQIYNATSMKGGAAKLPLKMTIDIGEFQFYAAYKKTNTKYTWDGSQRALTLLKPTPKAGDPPYHGDDENGTNGTTQGGYIITPWLTQGVASVHFDMKVDNDAKRMFKLWGSRVQNPTMPPQWELLKVDDDGDEFEVPSQKDFMVEVNDDQITHLKLELVPSIIGGEEKWGDANIDNLCVRAIPRGIPSAITTLEPDEDTDATSEDILVKGSITDLGTGKFVEKGVYYAVAKGSETLTPTAANNTLRYQGSETNQPEDFQMTIPDLDSEKTVFYRMFVTTLAGTSMGEVKSLTTKKAEKATLLLSSVTASDDPGKVSVDKDGTKVAVTLALDVQNNGGAHLTDLGVAWTTDGSKPKRYSKRVEGDPTRSSFTITLPLVTGQAYKFIGYAVNKAGDSYSAVEERTFTAPTAKEYPNAKTYYVDYNAKKSGTELVDKDEADGSEAAPFYLLQSAADLAQPGDKILVKPGNYKYNKPVVFNRSGESAKGMIEVRCERNTAFFNFGEEAPGDDQHGFIVHGSYWHFYGLTVWKAKSFGLYVGRVRELKTTDDDSGSGSDTGSGSGSGSDTNAGTNADNDSGTQASSTTKAASAEYETWEEVADKTDQAHDNVFEKCVFKNNDMGGVRLGHLAAGNRFINCDACYNQDQAASADGFQLYKTYGDGNYFYGCRAYQNADDGWDIYWDEQDSKDELLSAIGGNYPTVTLESCWAMRNGFEELSQPTTEPFQIKVGDEVVFTELRGEKWVKTGSTASSGFKLGSKFGHANVVCNRCLATDNHLYGFYANQTIGDVILNNCTAYGEQDLTEQRHMSYCMDNKPALDQTIKMTNCFCPGDGNDNRAKSKWAPHMVLREVTQVNCNFNVDTIQLKGVSYGLDKKMYLGRNSDGGLPYSEYMRPKKAADCPEGLSALIDKGAQVYRAPGEAWNSVSIAWTNAAPDLGCFEDGVRRVPTTPPTPKPLAEQQAPEPEEALQVLQAAPTAATLRVIPSKSGLATVSLPGANENDSHQVMVYSLDGRLVAAKPFRGAQTVVDLGAQRGLLLVYVPEVGAVKVAVRE